MFRTTALLVAFALSLTLVPDGAMSQPTGVQYQLIIDCPTTLLITGNPNCPVRAVDADDQMGDPSLAVDPFEPQNLILASLHGTSGCGGPSVKSRCRQPFTTFTSTDHGARWVDRPFVAPGDVGRPAFGEHPQVTIDPYGRVYIGSLYAQGVGDQEFEYVIAAQKFSSLQSINREQDGEFNVHYLNPIYQGNAIGQMWFLFNPQTDNMTMVWHENVTKISQNNLGRDDTCKPPTPRDRPSTTGSSSTTSTSYTTSTTSSSSSSTTTTSSATSSTSGSTTATSSSTTSTTSSTSSSTSTTTSSTSSSTSTTTSSTTSSTPVLNGRLQGLSLLTSSAAAPSSSAKDPATSPEWALTLPPVAGPPSGLTAQPSAVQEMQEPRSVIGIVWTGSATNSCYQYQPHEWVIGPCVKSTNPVLSEGYLYVGCVASTEEGEFPYNSDTVHGQVEMFRMHPDGGEPQYIGATPIHGGTPKLGVRSDGRLALATANATEDGRLQLSAAFGQYDNKTGRIGWTSMRGYGADIIKVEPGVDVVAASIQDLLYREHSGVLHFILKTTVKPNGTLITSVTDSILPDYRKMIVALSEDYGVLAKLPFDLGNLRNRTDTNLLNAAEEAYDDLSDDYLQLPQQSVYEYVDRTGRQHLLEYYQREFFAIADYGIVLFAEVIEITNLKGPAFPNPAQPPPPVPAAATNTIATNVTVPAAGLTMAGALALALLSTKRKEAALVRARKGRR